MNPPNCRGRFFKLPPNRVWRSYLGGRMLDEIAGAAAPADGHFPEDWIASLTAASNPAPSSPGEGLSAIELDGKKHLLRDVIAADPPGFLGRAHFERFGADPHILVKFLDSAIRLHFQVHPSREFARRFLGAPSGKTEAYHVLGVRPGHEGVLWLGFQRPPSRDRLRRLIEAQDIPALKACFDPVLVRPGDTFIVPGGTPHALGSGLFVVEMQEPSDLVVRFEFERGGYVLPEDARFMKRGLDFCLDIFDLAPRPLTETENPFKCTPARSRALSARSREDDLINNEFFRMKKLRVADAVDVAFDGFALAIVTSGSCRATALSSGYSATLSPYEKAVLPAALGSLRIEPVTPAEILLCQPPGAVF
ncbi:MAG: class I mannose-6-phosphate isomerase [Opitutaceae bacterium]|jgi:mannose-6-phosphate isomerase|nr:class I mannose-6-phosphate isomerase [Opitutaceae bacterium]